MTAEERREFVRAHRTCVFGYGRRHDDPSMTIVYYVMDADDILVSTMAERGKAKAVRRNPKVSLCVMDEKWPPTYLQVYCDASVETDVEAATDLMMRKRDRAPACPSLHRASPFHRRAVGRRSTCST